MDYIRHTIDLSDNKPAHRPTTSQVPFCGSSSYKNEFVNWGTTNLPIVRKAKGGVYTLPFKGRSSYDETFTPIDLSLRAQPFFSPYLLSA